MTVEELIIQLNRMDIFYGGCEMYAEGVDARGVTVRIPIRGEPWLDRDAKGNQIVVMRQLR
jgi:hypothetical protein